MEAIRAGAATAITVAAVEGIMAAGGADPTAAAVGAAAGMDKMTAGQVVRIA